MYYTTVARACCRKVGGSKARVLHYQLRWQRWALIAEVVGSIADIVDTAGTAGGMHLEQPVGTGSDIVGVVGSGLAAEGRNRAAVVLVVVKEWSGFCGHPSSLVRKTCP